MRRSVAPGDEVASPRGSASASTPVAPGPRHDDHQEAAHDSCGPRVVVESSQQVINLVYLSADLERRYTIGRLSTLPRATKCFRPCRVPPPRYDYPCTSPCFPARTRTGAMLVIAVGRIDPMSVEHGTLCGGTDERVGRSP